jgi:transglutaminase-like putative cysteine protease
MTATRMEVSLRPNAREAVDGAAILILTILALIGFRTSFAGSAYLVTGIAAAVLGLASAHVAARLGHTFGPEWVRPIWARLAAMIVVFVVLSGPLAFRSQALGGVIPTPASVHGLVDGLINGWANLLTSIPPSGNFGGVLAVPYLCGFLATSLAVALSLHWPRLPLGVLPPVIVLAVGILFGTTHPAAQVLQGAVFAVIALVWASVRADRYRTVIVHRTRSFHLGATIGLLAVIVAGAAFIGPNLPLASAHSRYILRDRFQPPFDPENDPSPLIAYRKYVTGRGANQELLVVQGLPKGATIQVATLDGYDGVVWLTTGSGGQAAGIFDRAGARIPDATHGQAATVTIENNNLTGVWLPTVGSPRSITFSGQGASTLGETWRFNPATNSAAIPGGLTTGADYTIKATIASPPPAKMLRKLPLVTSAVLPPPPGVPPALTGKAADIVRGATDPYDQAVKLEKWFQQGYYSNGAPNTGVAPGHSLARLTSFLASDHPVGDAEQYAAAMGLLARALGMPVRVVVGFRPKVTGDAPIKLLGKDLDAWVEIDFQGAGWIPFYPTPPRSRTTQQHTVQQVHQQNNLSQPPPPTTVPPVTVPPQLSQAQTAKHRKGPSKHKGPKAHPAAGSDILAEAIGGAFGVLLLILIIPPIVVLALKARRRQRRRHRSDPSAQVVGAWNEVLDAARDMGLTPPPRSTRREAAAGLPAGSATALASEADAAVFGPDAPDKAVSTSVWRRSEETIRAMRATLDPRHRLLASISLASLRRSRPPAPPKGAS